MRVACRFLNLNLAEAIHRLRTAALFFQPFCGNECNWIFRNLEFKEKILEFSEKILEFSRKFLEFRQKILEFSRKILEFGGKWLGFILKNGILLTKIVIRDDLATFSVLS